MCELVRDWTQLANRASDHLSRSLYLSTPYPPHYMDDGVFDIYC